MSNENEKLTAEKVSELPSTYRFENVTLSGCGYKFTLRPPTTRHMRFGNGKGGDEISIGMYWVAFAIVSVDECPGEKPEFKSVDAFGKEELMCDVNWIMDLPAVIFTNLSIVVTKLINLSDDEQMRLDFTTAGD